MNNKIANRTAQLSLNESKYWRRFFTNNLKIGLEIECCYSRRTSDPIARLREVLAPSGSYGKFGKCGVFDVKGDGSLDNGAEICTTGRRLDFLDLYYQYKFICDKMIRLRANMNARAGLHNHIMLDFGRDYNSMEKPVPGIILKNFIQLCKMFAPEMVWITSTVCQDEEGNTNLPIDQYGPWITRRSGFCTHRNLLNCDVSRDINSIKSAMQNGDGGRYKFLNLQPLELIDNNNISRFHVELRFPDGSMYPAQMAAQNMLWAAMIIKAIKISEAGLVDEGENFTQTKSLMALLRGTEDNRSMRCSVPPSEASMDMLRERSLEMIKYFKPELDRFDVHIYPVLKVLATQPVSIMRREMDDEGVNSAFNRMINTMYEENMDDCNPLIEYIALQNKAGYRTENEWKEVACTDLSIPRNDIDRRMTIIGRHVDVKFDKTIGAYVII